MMSFLPRLKVKKLDPKAILPAKGSASAAGYDICALENSVVPAKGKACIPTGLALVVPEGNYARLAPRSGLASKNFIDVGAGVVDSDYRGEVKVLLFNFGSEDFPVSAGDRIAQCIIEKYTPTVMEEIDELPSTQRGAGGFGSTGVSEKILKEKDLKEENVSESKNVGIKRVKDDYSQAKKSPTDENVNNENTDMRNIN